MFKKISTGKSRHTKSKKFRNYVSGTKSIAITVGIIAFGAGAANQFFRTPKNDSDESENNETCASDEVIKDSSVKESSCNYY